jgi:hypothetical protein
MFPKKGNKLHNRHEELAFARMLADTLNAELGQTHQAIKTTCRWTGACERTVKHWFAGTHAPSGHYLLLLMRNSDRVVMRLLKEAGRDEMGLLIELDVLRLKLVEILALVDRSDTPTHPPESGSR